jgi:hypothetical protein
MAKPFRELIEDAPAERREPIGAHTEDTFVPRSSLITLDRQVEIHEFSGSVQIRKQR